MKFRRCLWVGALLGVTLIASRTGAAPGWTRVDRVVAVVNRDLVLASEIDARIAAYEASLDQVKDAGDRARRRLEVRRSALRDVIDEMLLVQEASRQGLDVSDDEVTQAMREVQRQNNLDEATMLKELEKNGFTVDRYRVELRRQLLRIKVLNLLIRPRVSVSDADVRAAYDQAKARDPNIGAFEAISGQVRQQLFERGMAIEVERWLASRHRTAFVEVRE